MKKGRRCYTRHSGKGKLVLTSWIQEKCIRCHRYLSKSQIKYCKKCAKITRHEQHNKDSKLYTIRHKEKIRKHDKERYIRRISKHPSSL